MLSPQCFLCLTHLPVEVKGSSKRVVASTLNNFQVEIKDLMKINGVVEADQGNEVDDKAREQLLQNLSACSNCLNPIKLVVSSKSKVDKVETTVRKLQVNLLKQLRKLEQCLEGLWGELEVIGGIIQSSEDVRKGALTENGLTDDVRSFRKDILKVKGQLQRFRNGIKNSTSAASNFPESQNKSQNSGDISPQSSIKIKTEPETSDLHLNNYDEDADELNLMEFDDHFDPSPSDTEDHADIPPPPPPTPPEIKTDPPANKPAKSIPPIPKRKYSRIPNTCQKCSKTFTKKSSLLNHQKTYHRNDYLQETIFCPHCHQTMARQLLRTHKLHHCPCLKRNKPTTFLCTICKENFLSVDLLKEHNLEEHVEKLKNMCETCGKISVSRQAHQMHQNTHVDPRNRQVVECEDCGKMILATSIDSHRRLGCPKRENSSFLCHFCQKYFSNESNLGKHVRRMHKGQEMEKSHEEESCGGPVKPMGQRRKIKVIAEEDNHDNLQEDEEDKLDNREIAEDSDPEFIPPQNEINRKSRGRRGNPVKCPKCPRTFTMARALKKHKITYHKNDYLSESTHCPHCLESMPRKLLRTHQFYHCPVKSKDIIYTCTLCKPSADEDLEKYEHPIFPNLESLKSHVATQHAKRMLALICDTCGLISSSLDSHLRHQVRHVDPKNREFVECDDCGKSILATSVSSHKRLGCPKRERTRFPCVYCSKTFSTEMAVVKHVSRWHTGINGELLVKPRRPKQLQCHLCGKWIQDKSQMRRHLKSRHLGWEERDDKVVCEYCGKEMLQVSLGQHERYHCTGKEREVGVGITCETCGKGFNLRATLRWHKKVVHGSDRFVCELCGKVFPASSSYKKHLERHKGIRRFLCELGCGRRFTQKHHVLRHTRLGYCLGEEGPRRKERRLNLEIGGNVEQTE